MQRWLLVLAGLALGSVALAGIEADPTKDYTITPEAGPWMICATSYVGPEASQLAHELVLEIRSRFNLPAYVVNRGEEERKKQREEYQRLLDKHPGVTLPFRHTRVEDQCAVLIGGYKDMDAASKALKSVKKLQPPSNTRLMPILTEVGPDQSSKEEGRAVVKGGYVNPFPTSFVVHNPTIPVEKPSNTIKADPFLRRINAPESLSLLKCRKPWTLAIATYQGVQAIQADKPEAAGFWENLWKSSSGETLEASGHNAHNFADALRKGNFEAYVLHVRWGSVVTVGSFESLDDPRMASMKRVLGSLNFGQGINMLPEPMPMEVPR